MLILGEVKYSIDTNGSEPIEKALRLLVDCFRRGGKLLLCGNGGSAADCEHIVGELMKGMNNGRLMYGLPPLQGALPAISLCSQVGLITALAEAMIGIGRSFGRRVTALVTDMSQPLGALVGNALEVVECVEVLNGRGPEDLVALCRELCAHCLLLGDAVPDLDAGRALYARQIASGRALSKFAEMVDAQGGDVAAIEDTSRLPRARHEEEVPAAEDAFVGAIDTEKLGRAMCTLGAGRETMESRVDPAVGMRVCRKVATR